ncbi:MAG: hypothetical protein ACFFDB_00080 [Promethearchaeota archaeon]
MSETIKNEESKIITIKKPGYQEERFFNINLNGEAIDVDQIRFATHNADKCPALTIFIKAEKKGAGQKQIHAKLQDIESISINIKKETLLEEFR